jgi:hypothetical protein
MGSSFVSEKLGRSITAVQDRALRLGVPGKNHRGWTEFERRYLQRNYPDISAAAFARTLGRTEQSVRAQLHKMGLTEQRALRWTSEQEQALRAGYGTEPVDRLAESLGRTVDAVQLKAARLGLALRQPVFEPTRRQLEFILRNLGRRPFTEIAQLLHTTPHAIRRIAIENGYRDRPTSRAWSSEDDSELRRIYGTMPRAEVAAKLGRTRVAVAARAASLGLTRPSSERSEPRPWAPEEDAQLRRMVRRCSYVEIAAHLGRTRVSVAARARHLGLAKQLFRPE